MNTVEIEGFTSFSKVDNFQNGQYRHRFSITLQAGKERDGSYRKEYLDVRLSSDCSVAIQYPGDGTRIKVKGRMRCEPWVDRTQQKRKAIYLEAFEAQVISPPSQQYQQQGQQTLQPQPGPQVAKQYQQPAPQVAKQYQQPAPQYQQPTPRQAPQAPRYQPNPNPELDDIPF